MACNRADAALSSAAWSGTVGPLEQELSAKTTVIGATRCRNLIFYRRIALFRSSTLSSTCLVSLGRWYDSSSDGYVLPRTSAQKA